MNWLFYSLLAPAIFAINVLVDKYILEKEVSDYQGMPIYTSIMAAIFGILLWFMTGFPLLNSRDALLIMLTGMLTLWGAAFYFKALSNQEASNIIILFQTGPILTLILAYLFLRNTITNSQLIGFFIILLATVGVSLNTKKSNFKLSPAFFLILFANLFWSFAAVIAKFVLEYSSFSRVISFESFGIALGGLILYILFPSFSKAFKKTQKNIRKVALLVILTNEGVYLVGRFITFLAISLGPVALVGVIGGTQVFAGILLGYFLTLIAPKIFQENISGKGLFKKITIGMFVFLGLWLIKG